MSMGGAIIIRLHSGCGSGWCSVLMYKEYNLDLLVENYKTGLVCGLNLEQIQVYMVDEAFVW